MVTRRARSFEDKVTRRNDIVTAAGDVFDATEADEFTMHAVATKLGLAKGTLYRYVPTREALLLALAADEYDAWFDRVDARLASAPVVSVAATADSVARLLVDEIVRIPRFLRLASMVPSVLERNVPFETAFAYKSALVVRSRSTSDLLAGRLDVAVDDARRVLIHLQAIAVGLHQLAHPAPIIAQVMADPSFRGASIDERAELDRAALAIVNAARAT